MAGARVPSRTGRGADDTGRGRAARPLRQRLAGLSWPVVAALAAVVTALVGLVPPVALAVVGWVGAPDVGFGTALELGVRGWLLGHGAPVEAGGIRLAQVPLGVPVVALLTGSGLAAIAARRAMAASDEEPSAGARRSAALRVAGVFTLAYAVCLAVGALAAGSGAALGRAVAGGLVVGALASVVGAARESAWDPTRGWPVWARAIPQAVAAALAVAVGTGALAALVALLSHRAQFTALHDALQPGIAGGIVMLLLQLAWLPNLAVWGASWALGAGFRVGQGTLVSPAYNLTAMLPGVPVLGAIGPNGPGRPWAMAWLASGILAGAAAAWTVVRGLRRSAGRRAIRFDEATLVGGLAGAVSGLCLVVLAALATGGLGSGRLSEVGPRLAPLSVMAPVLMGLSGLVVGLVLGLTDRRPQATDQAGSGATVAQRQSQDPDEEQTVVVDDRPRVQDRAVRRRGRPRRRPFGGRSEAPEGATDDEGHAADAGAPRDGIDEDPAAR